MVSGPMHQVIPLICVQENNSLLFWIFLDRRMLPPFKVSELAQMNGCLRLRSYVNVYPISDSSVAVGHLILSVWPPTVPARRFKSSVTSSRVSSHSRHILIFKATRRDSTCHERYRRKTHDGTQVWSQGPSGQPSCLLALWLGGPGRRGSH